MNIYTSLNEMLEYIEENLENKIEYDKLSKILGTNEAMLQRLFSMLCNKCKNVIFSDGCANSENIIACQKSGTCSFALRVANSADCTNSYNVICSSKISNSYFIQDCNNLYECIFCSHIANKRYCIANMQFEKEEYAVIKKAIEKWILTKK